MYDTKKDAIIEIFEVENISIKINNWSFKVKVSYIDLIEAISKESYTLATELNVSSATAVNIVKYLWPDKPGSNIKICTYLLNKYGYKYCSSCKKVKEIDLFSKNTSRAVGLNTHCKECYLENTRSYQREYQKSRKALKMNRVPTWADITKIREIYKNCPEGYHVDHIVPLQGELVSGLHVENNLQYLIAVENLKKHNKFIV